MSPDPAADVAYDFVEILMDALLAAMLDYEVVAVYNGFDIEVPNILIGQDIRYTDRGAIIARSDLKTSDLKLSNVHFGTYDTKLPISVAGSDLLVTRGWIRVDVKIRGKPFRLMSTHLESYHPLVQVAQTLELLDELAFTHLPVVLVGDFNSEADGSGTATYALLTGNGLSDVWSIAGAGPGFTCCQAPHLSNPTSILASRIDLVLVRGEFTPMFADVVGEESADRSLSGLWPSDHAGVTTRLRFRVF